MQFIVWTAGFFYKDWIWRFYPRDLPWSEWLQYYAQHFNWLEVNSSFYRLPAKSTIEGFAKVDLIYVFKVPRLFTHLKKYDKEVLKQFADLLEPLTGAWKLGGLLFQFSAKATKEQVLQCLEFARSGFKDDVMFFVELRNLNLINEFSQKENVDLLKDLWASLVYVDWRLRGNVLIYDWQDLGFEQCYFRFHWRWERLYNYLYSEDELKQFATKIRQICSDKKRCFAFFNNTVKAQAVENAKRLRELVEGG